MTHVHGKVVAPPDKTRTVPVRLARSAAWHSLRPGGRLPGRLAVHRARNRRSRHRPTCGGPGGPGGPPGGVPEKLREKHRLKGWCPMKYTCKFVDNSHEV